MTYRPWGLLDWLLTLSAPRRWHFLGVIGTEERSLAAWEWLCSLGAEGGRSFLQISDMESRYTDLAQQRLEQRLQRFREAGGNDNDISRFELLDELYRIEECAKSVEIRAKSLIVDITSLPKRFFFPLLRSFYRSEAIEDLIVTYTSAESYEVEQPLSELADEAFHLPGFPAETEKSEVLIVGVGFLAESLQKHVGSIVKHEAIKILIPFPSSLDALGRVWESVYRLESPRSAAKFENYRVDATDMSGAFDRIVSLARATTASPAFAPFGPKPISAAMGLYALQRGSAVYYPQPKIYHPDYSKGVGKVGGKPAITAYWVKHEGQGLYDIPQ